MDLQIAYLPVHELTTITVIGCYDAQSITASLNQMYADPRFLSRHRLWDFRAATLDLSGDDLRQVSQLLIGRLRLAPPHRKVALVMHGDLSFGLGRMLQIHIDVVDVAADIEVFRTMEDALAWLGVDPADRE